MKYIALFIICIGCFGFGFLIGLCLALDERKKNK